MLRSLERSIELSQTNQSACGSLSGAVRRAVEVVSTRALAKKLTLLRDFEELLADATSNEEEGSKLKLLVRTEEYAKAESVSGLFMHYFLSWERWKEG